MKKLAGKKKHLRTAATLATMLIVLAAGGILLSAALQGGRRQTEQAGREEQAERRPSYESLSASDREVADVYAELYEMTAEEVAAIQVSTGDWEKTWKELEKGFFTISENRKYQMEQEGYSIEDLEEAEKLSASSGIKAAELIEAKGKADDGKSWEEVKKEKGIEEEQGTDTK